MEIIAEAARNRQFISYKTVAVQSGVKWNSANVAMPKHLLAVSEYGHRKGLPMLSAIVVSQSHVADGGMDAPTLEGFVQGRHSARPRGDGPGGVPEGAAGGGVRRGGGREDPMSYTLPG